jgi:formate hydrogenlyase subunit 3/multisubunit Na+/H+ antiporter MnhD subunit
VAPLLLAPAVRTRPAVIRAAIGAVAGALVLVVVGGYPDALRDALAPAGLSPGLGVANVAIYFGAERGGAVLMLLAALVVAASVVLAPRLAARPEPERWAAAAVLLLAGLWVAPGSSPHDLATPLALLAVAGSAFSSPVTARDADDADSPDPHRFDRPGARP